MTIVLIRLGDFYEALGEHAKEVSRVCGITLTKHRASGQPMCGIPAHALFDRQAELEAAGHKVELQ